MRTFTQLARVGLASFILILSLTKAGNAQTVTYSCTSKDLYADKAYFTGFDICKSPAPGTKFSVTLRIVNKTNSTRNAAAFWAKLYKIKGGVRTQEGGNIYYCTGSNANPAIGPGGYAEYKAVNEVAFEEGARYVLTDILLAWTNASKNASCLTIEADFGSSISPKCAYMDSLEIPVNIVPNATISSAATCYNGGKASILVEPTGGKRPYTIELKADSIGNRSLGSASSVTSKTFDNVPLGKYLVIVTDQTPCKDTQSISVTVSSNLPAPQVTKTDEPAICGKATGTMAIVSPNGANTYYLIANGNTSAITKNDSIPVPAGSNPKFFYTNSVCGSDTLTFCPETLAGLIRSTTIAQKNTGSNYMGAGEVEESVFIKTVPNPFSDRVKFVINLNEPGQGMLEIFNLQGQKVKTLFQGYMPAGANFYELTVSNKRRADLIYVFTKDGVKSTGKLVQLAK
jgi:hypothetical protein